VQINRQWLVAVSLCLACSMLLSACQKPRDDATLRAGISPYQEQAMLANIKPLGLEKKYGVPVELVTMSWEDVPPALASAGKSIDVGFVSLADLLAKQSMLNTNKDDPVVFAYPICTFGGMSFVSFNPDVPVLTANDLNNPGRLKKFLSYKIGAKKYSQEEFMLFKLAQRAGIPLSQLNIIVIPYNDGLLAAQNGSLDMTAAGRPQRAEALKRGGRVVVSADILNFFDANGIACKLSTLKTKRKQIQAFIHMWFDCVNYVDSDMDKNSKCSREYLDKTASTRYTLLEYKQSLADDYFPHSCADASREMISPSGKYSLDKEYRDIIAYLKAVDAFNKPPAPPKILDMSQ
jgi:ABC-type nitrate/sulfonate/bicarbonate transport system substrate-binding protein